jgi:hypothetical protein
MYDAWYVMRPYVLVPIRCGDAYFIPAKCAHEFITFAEATTLAWHVHTVVSKQSEEGNHGGMDHVVVPPGIMGPPGKRV